MRVGPRDAGSSGEGARMHESPPAHPVALIMAPLQWGLMTIKNLLAGGLSARLTAALGYSCMIGGG